MRESILINGGAGRVSPKIYIFLPASDDDKAEKRGMALQERGPFKRALKSNDSEKATLRSRKKTLKETLASRQKW